MSLALKHIVGLALSAGFAAAVGVAGSAFVAERMFLGGVASLVASAAFPLQLLLVFFIKSEEERELLLRRQIILKQLQGDLEAAEELGRRIRREIRDGDVESAKRWAELRRRLR